MHHLETIKFALALSRLFQVQISLNIINKIQCYCFPLCSFVFFPHCIDVYFLRGGWAGGGKKQKKNKLLNSFVAFYKRLCFYFSILVVVDGVKTILYFLLFFKCRGEVEGKENKEKKILRTYSEIISSPVFLPLPFFFLPSFYIFLLICTLVKHFSLITSSTLS